jgi:muramoyltetrapeptide carboxypeptidase
MKVVKPKKLSNNDLIGVVSPSSLPSDLSRINKGIEYLEKCGFRVKVGKNVGKFRGYLAGTDEERLSDIHDMFSDKEVKAVFAIRGGYGSGRLLEKLNYNLIKKNPKIFVGYSDITALQNAIFSKTGLITFAGPMVAVDFGGDKINEFAEANFWEMLTNNKKVGKLLNPNSEKLFVLNKGRGEGKLLGGNLAVLASLFGSTFVPSFKNSILFIEEIGESPYRVDRMLNQLKIAGVFKNLQGVLLGRFVDCYETDAEKKSLTLNEVIADYFNDLKIPVMYNFIHGHVPDTLTVPIGANAKINTSRGFVEITENVLT